MQRSLLNDGETARLNKRMLLAFISSYNQTQNSWTFKLTLFTVTDNIRYMQTYQTYLNLDSFRLMSYWTANLSVYYGKFGYVIRWCVGDTLQPNLGSQCDRNLESDLIRTYILLFMPINAKTLVFRYLITCWLHSTEYNSAVFRVKMQIDISLQSPKTLLGVLWSCFKTAPNPSSAASAPKYPSNKDLGEMLTDAEHPNMLEL